MTRHRLSYLRKRFRICLELRLVIVRFIAVLCFIAIIVRFIAIIVRFIAVILCFIAVILNVVKDPCISSLFLPLSVLKSASPVLHIQS